MPFLSGSQRLLVASFVLAMAAPAFCGQAPRSPQWEKDIKAFEAAEADQDAISTGRVTISGRKRLLPI